MSHILLQITFDCNLDCGFCSIKDNHRDAFVEECLVNIKKKAGEVEWVFITGGEPLLVENLSEICDDLRAFGFKVGVTTNGTIFRPEIAEHVDRIGISIDGDKEFHDKSRGEGVYDKAITLLKAIKDKCETVVMSIALKDNQDALLRLKPIVEKIDPTYWQIRRDIHDPSVLIAV